MKITSGEAAREISAMIVAELRSGKMEKFPEQYLGIVGKVAFANIKLWFQGYGIEDFRVADVDP